MIVDNEVSNLKVKLVKDIWYSPRRYFVDKFFIEKVNLFAKGSSIIDLGGKKEHKRGEFNIEKYELKVVYANLDEKTEPDFLCDITHIPVEDNSFDGAILGEVLEHVFNPLEILAEAYRILKPGGILLITTPFVYNLHADPYDYARYTDYWYEKALSEVGFQDIVVEKQGRFVAVIANMLKTFETSTFSNKKIKIGFKKAILSKLNKWLLTNMFSLDDNANLLMSPIFAGYTTGFGVVAKKS